VSPREGAIKALQNVDGWNVDADPADVLDTVVDYLSDERVELCYQFDLDYATVERLFAALRIQENQP
jgi:hypothetical protein